MSSDEEWLRVSGVDTMHIISSRNISCMHISNSGTIRICSGPVSFIEGKYLGTYDTIFEAMEFMKDPLGEEFSDD